MMIKPLTTLMALALLGGCAQHHDQQDTHYVLSSDVGRDSIEYVIEDNVAHMSGVMDSSTYDLTLSLLDNNPQVDTISLDNVLGTIHFAVTLQTGYLLRERGINTHIPFDGVATSGAVYLFMAGDDRTIELGARIGIHQWKIAEYDDSGNIIGGLVATDYEEDDSIHSQYIDYHYEMDNDESFYWVIANTPFDHMAFLSVYEMVQYDLITGIERSIR